MTEPEAPAATLEQFLDRLEANPGKVCIVGSANADLSVRVRKLPRPGETVTGGPLTVRPGGKSANQAAAAALLGADVEIVAAVGTDSYGRLLNRSLARAGVHLEHLSQIAQPTGTALIAVDDSAENFIVISPGANGAVDAALVREHASAVTAAGALGLCLEVADSAVLEAARIARAAHVPTVLNLSPFRDVMTELLSVVDLVIMNEHELAALTGKQSITLSDTSWVEIAAELMRRYAIDTAVVTLGAIGSVVLTTHDGPGGPTVQHVAAYPARVVDTTGSGDAYVGALLAGIAASLTVAESARLASIAAAYAAQGEGASSSYGSAADIRTFAFS